MRTASSTASCAAGVWANTAVVTSKRVNRVGIAVLDARGTDLVAGPRGSRRSICRVNTLFVAVKLPVHSGRIVGESEVGTTRRYSSESTWDRGPQLPCCVIRTDVRHCSQHAGANVDFGDEGAVDWAFLGNLKQLRALLLGQPSSALPWEKGSLPMILYHG